MKRMTEGENIAATRGAESGSLAKGLQVLDTLRQALQPLAHSEVAEATGLAPSTAHRVLQMLVDARQVDRTPGGRYRPAARSLLPLGLDHPMNLLRRDSTDLLRGLRDRHGPSTSLILFFGLDRCILETALGRYSVVPYYDTHVSAPHHTTVSGKLLLAHLASAQRAAVLDAQPLAARTPHSIVERSALERELDRARREGCTTNLQENVAGICACGAVLLSPKGSALGALVMSGPSQYFADEALQAMKRDLLDAASLLSHTSSAMRSFARFLE
ncbi:MULTISPECIES: IclR family transcriptional regulator C-terminal domain-containing protein [unclassified Variovorax]|uniref:IclR family transcriptional regulator n=1 Tax=unclassified Variovorax TaxID=663243 RepID=UPI002574E825|nr:MULTISPECIES: IclR family transcriptional regulator C-terminal domain-containing protein [unclassified Variovorax]MDM0086692.1 IclR family transcriptional regulator C-terminal domain-containing protein [Variovorax sp. J22G40]MDM0145052.1 IclR family transcriptional regulator C-terminal domain-containing protein [Variovorax sp. J2P1-31]